MVKASAPLHVSELEQSLSGPDGPQVRAKLLADLKEIETYYRELAADGLDRSSMKLCQAAIAAAVSAIAVLTRYPVNATPSPTKQLLH